MSGAASTGALARSLDQRHAADALACVKRLIAGENSEFLGAYRSYVERLAAAIIMNGLGQALATERAAAGMGEGGGRSKGRRKGAPAALRAPEPVAMPARRGSVSGGRGRARSDDGRLPDSLHPGAGGGAGVAGVAQEVLPSAPPTAGGGLSWARKHCRFTGWRRSSPRCPVTGTSACGSTNSSTNGAASNRAPVGRRARWVGRSAGWLWGPGLVDPSDAG